MSNRSIRRSAVILAFAALLVPFTGLSAAQTRPHASPAKAASTTQHPNPIIQFLLRVLAGTGLQIDSGVMIDQNG